MKITVYTITDCQFSKQEKEYLKANDLPFEEKNLETNKEFLTEMLAVSNNFAGTPVTKIEKDDGQIVVLKGFTKEEYDTALGLTPPPTEIKPEAKVETKPDAKPVTPPAPIPPVPPTNGQAVPPPVQAPAPQPAVNDPLNAVLQDLQAKSAQTPPATDQPQPVTPPVQNPPLADQKPPVVETPPQTNLTNSTSSTVSTNPLPSIPDFQDKM